MVTDKEIKEAEQNIPKYLADGLISKNKGNVQLVSFYVETAKNSFLVAQHLYKLSINKDLKKNTDFTEDFECFLWVIVPAYYSMFYIANAALSKLGLKVGDKIPHKVTQDALIVYFIKNNKLAKYLLENYIETKNEVMNLMNVTEEELLKQFQLKATELISTFDYQRRKRGEFQYVIKTPTKQTVANTALERAENFIKEMNLVIDRIN